MNDQQWQAIVSLPSLAGCPECGMTNVIREAWPVVICKSCARQFWAKGIIVPASDEIISFVDEDAS